MDVARGARRAAGWPGVWCSEMGPGNLMGEGTKDNPPAHRVKIQKRIEIDLNEIIFAAQDQNTLHSGSWRHG